MKLERLAKLGAGVAVLGMFGCSDPVPPPAQASLFFVIGPPEAAGAGCAISGSYVARIGGGPVRSTGDPGERAVDGQGSNRVGCRVSGGSLSGSAETDTTGFMLLGGSISGPTGKGTISVSGPGTAGKQLTSAENGCDLNVARPPLQLGEDNV